MHRRKVAHDLLPEIIAFAVKGVELASVILSGLRIGS
jgi:hypothetical protein